MSVVKQHKDRVFKFIFGNPENKQWTLSLYNALNDSEYTDCDAIEFNTIDEILYVGMHNDVSFIIFDVLNIWEHQSSLNPNMPIRFFLHAAQLYDKYMTAHNCYRYGRFLIKLPCPKCICFYNGTDEQPEETVLMLSDSFGNGNEKTEADIEVKVRMLNINYGKSRAVMDVCEPLREYSWLVERIRHNGKGAKKASIEEAVDKTLDEMPDDFVIKKFLLMHRAEVKGMFLTEYDEEKILAQERQEGAYENQQRVAGDMLKKKFPLSIVEEISRLPEDVIRGIANNLGLSVV